MLKLFVSSFPFPFYPLRTISEGSAVLEGITSVCSGAGTDGLMVGHFAVGSDATGTHARVDTLELNAGLGS